MKPCRRRWIAVLGLTVVAGCAPMVSRVELPDRHALVREQLEIHSDSPIPAQHRLLEELTARRYDLSRSLDLPVSNEPILVYLFDDGEAFRAFMGLRHPDFPRRRAFFIETDTRLTVYAHWGDRVAEDLRHETVHGYLHSMVPNLPLWLDEGLAEYFEVPRGYQGRHRAHLSRLLARVEHGDWQPNLTRLEQIDSRDAFDMSQDDYAESWAWVHFLLRSRPENLRLLQQYLARLRRDAAADPIGMQLQAALGRPDLALVDHLRRLAAGQR
jgi:hypothetical protein